MKPGIPARVCPACRGGNLVNGQVHSEGMHFHPADWWSLIGYAMSAHACLDCGHVSLFLEDYELEMARKKKQGS
jgi:hypothetical protein